MTSPQGQQQRAQSDGRKHTIETLCLASESEAIILREKKIRLENSRSRRGQ